MQPFSTPECRRVNKSAKGIQYPPSGNCWQNARDPAGFKSSTNSLMSSRQRIRGRKEFGNMLRLRAGDRAPRIVLGEQTDRLYRNRADAVAVEELIETHGIEVHLVKEARVIAKDSRSQDKFMHDIHVAVAKNYIENLRDEVKKGMREKAEQGIYPGRAPLGYRNNRLTRSIDVDESKAALVRRIFDLYSTANFSLTTLRQTILKESGVRINRAYLETLLKNPFYIGQFVWRGVTYEGKHRPLISVALFRRIQEVFAGRNKPKYRKHHFAFAGLLRCSYDDCTVTTELQKRIYTYYRCSHGRGKCAFPYLREEQVAKLLGQVLKEIYVPEGVAAQIVASLDADLDRTEQQRKSKLAAIQQRLTAVRTRMDQVYEDKLDSKISEDFWNRKHEEYRNQELDLQAQAVGSSQPVGQENVLTAKRIFELATNAYSLYVTRNPAEQGELLKSVLLNYSTDGVSLWPVYKKPFELIFRRAKNDEWSGRADLNCRPLAPQASALPG
jgi:site-specific DNA recombinase